MATPRTLVFGDDGSADADTAWLWINNHRWPDWRAVVVTATMPDIGPPVGPELASLRPWEPPMPRVAFAEAELAEVEHVTGVIDPRLALGEYEPTPDLVVVGPTGRGMLKALRLGSTADWLMQTLAAPLVIARAARSAGRIVVCVDGSRHAQRAAEVLAGLPLVKGAEVTVLGVYDGWAETEMGMARATEVLEPAGAKVTPLEVRGKPTRTILEQIDEQAAGLVVLGSRGNTTLRRLFVGSTASAIAHSAPCSVLVANVGEDS